MHLHTDTFNWLLLLIPLLSALVGWATVQGLVNIAFRRIIPSQQANIAAQAGQFVEREFSVEKMEEKITSPSNFDNIRPLVESHIDDFLRNKLKEQMPMIGMFIGDKTIQQLKVIFIKEIEELFPQVMTQFAGNLRAELNPGQLVSSKLASLPPGQVEKLLASGLKQPLNRAALLAGLFGLLVGLLQLLIIGLAT